MDEMKCPCGSSLLFDDCCGPLLKGQEQARTAQQLMRSRYTAFTLANVDYLLRTHHPKTRPARDRQRIQAWAKSVKWQGLTVISAEQGFEADDVGYVEFRAEFIEDGAMDQIHEKSLFRREKGNWVYVSGTHL